MKQYLQKLLARQHLEPRDVQEVFSKLLSADAEVTDAQIGAYLFASAITLPSADELTAAAQQLRAHMLRIERPEGLSLLDTCGTGGSGHETFNTSTAVALVCVAAGQAVAKHGNRAATSRSGSADVLEALGIPLQLSLSAQSRLLASTGFVFLFAPDHHPATKRVAGLRRELGVRTIFNLLGPLVNPASVEYQLLGLSSSALLPIIADTVVALGGKRSLIVSARDGLDELSCGAINDVIEVDSTTQRRYEIDATQLGFPHTPVAALRVKSPQHSAELMVKVFQGEPSAARDSVVLNAAAALYVCGKVSSIGDGVELAKQLLDSGAVLTTLENVRAEARRLVEVHS